MNMHATVDQFVDAAGVWKEAITTLRAIALDTLLVETVKWGVPCYTYEGSNVVLIQRFKAYCGLLFVKGALLTDPEGLMIQQTPNVQGGRQVRFTSAAEVARLEPVLRAMIEEAIGLEKAGARVSMKPTASYDIPVEFKDVLAGMPELQAAFKALTPGRQRAWLLHFSAPKQAQTREARIQKALPRILNGLGVND